MSRAESVHLPATIDAASTKVSGTIERVIADVPPPRTHAVDDPARRPRPSRIVPPSRRRCCPDRSRCRPGPLGMLTVLPDLYLIWKTQRQMVADIFGLYGRTAELTRVHMLYCLFRHAASQVLRDVVVRTGQRVIVQQRRVRRAEGHRRQDRRHRQPSASPAPPRAGGCRWPAPPRSARMRIGTRCRSRKPRTGCWPASRDRRRRRLSGPIVPCAAATNCTPSRPRSRWRSACRFRLADAPALQHRADAGRADHPPHNQDGERELVARALGTGAALGEGSVDRREDDQRTFRNAGRKAVVPHGASSTTAA